MQSLFGLISYEHNQREKGKVGRQPRGQARRLLEQVPNLRMKKGDRAGPDKKIRSGRSSARMVSLITTPFVAVRRIWPVGDNSARRQDNVHRKTYVTQKSKCWTRIRHASDRMWRSPSAVDPWTMPTLFVQVPFLR